jgi:hypothetical protein
MALGRREAERPGSIAIDDKLELGRCAQRFYSANRGADFSNVGTSIHRKGA